MDNDNKIPAVTSSQSASVGRSRLPRLRNRRTIIILVIVVTVAAGAVSYYFYDRSNNETAIPTATTRATTYDETVAPRITENTRLFANHLLQGTVSGAGMKFSLPWEGFMYVDSPPDKSYPLFPQDGRESLSKIIPKEGNSVELGERIFTADQKATFQGLVAAKIVPAAEKSGFVSLDYFIDLLAKLSFNTSTDTSQLAVGINTPTSFTNDSITSGAQLYTVSANIPPAVGGVINHLLGQLVEVKGQRADYYLLIVAIDKNWNANPETWQAIKDSIKVDQ